MDTVKQSCWGDVQIVRGELYHYDQMYSYTRTVYNHDYSYNVQITWNQETTECIIAVTISALHKDSRNRALSYDVDGTAPKPVVVDLVSLIEQLVPPSLFVSYLLEMGVNSIQQHRQHIKKVS